MIYSSTTCVIILFVVLFLPILFSIYSFVFLPLSLYEYCNHLLHVIFTLKLLHQRLVIFQQIIHLQSGQSSSQKEELEAATAECEPNASEYRI